MDNSRLRHLAGLPPADHQLLNEAEGDSVHTRAIELIDEMLFKLPEEQQYGEQGDILRHILTVLQNQGN